MVAIATVTELASFLQVDAADINTTSAQLLLDLAQGLIEERIGEHDPWSVTAKAIVLEAAKRAYVNPEGLGQKTVGGTAGTFPDRGVYLTADEKARLSDWSNRGRGSIGTIRTTSGYPPIADECLS